VKAGGRRSLAVVLRIPAWVTVAQPEKGGLVGARTDRAKGRLKEAWGGLTSNKRMKDKGRADTATGTVKKKTGGAADKVKDRLD
jgi:uncharacterized protein YjbJ (UPF0337 family)